MYNSQVWEICMNNKYIYYVYRKPNNYGTTKNCKLISYKYKWFSIPDMYN